MAKIDKREIKLKKPNKRKLKEILEADSPTSKFKKLGNSKPYNLSFVVKCFILQFILTKIFQWSKQSRRRRRFKKLRPQIVQ